MKLNNSCPVRNTLTPLWMVAVVISFMAIPGPALAEPADDTDQPPRIAPPRSTAFGKTLQEWLGIYWRWSMSGADLEHSKVGRVQLMPIPAGDVIGGSFTPDDPLVLQGQLEITLPAGTPFVLPAFAWIGERYEGYPAVPDDLPIADEVLLPNAEPDLTIDGLTVLSNENKEAFYIGPTAFDPIVEYPAPSDYGSVAAVFFQGCGFVSPPLAPGVHVIHLYETLIIPEGGYDPMPDGLGIIYDNTWIVTVLPE